MLPTKAVLAASLKSRSRKRKQAMKATVSQPKRVREDQPVLGSGSTSGVNPATLNAKPKVDTSSLQMADA